ncbi:MAG: hypothetical protein JKY56_12040, partial [Kofleriaceae bacterium]|nr:hypothetical protein [Kofleriaceae bacterium]
MNVPIGHLLFATLIISSTACGGSSPPPICQPRAAWDTGRNQALAGQALNYQVGSMCQGASHSQFQTQLYAGYNEGLAQFCIPAMVQGHGRQDGRAGSAPRYNPQRYSICTRQDGFAQAYQAGYQIGVSEYCVPTGAEQAGYAAGQQGSPAQFDSRAYAVCPQQALELMAGSYNQAHARGVAEYCGQAAGQARAQGLAIGRQGRSTPLAASNYQLCSMPQIRAAYDEGTRAGLQEFCSPENAAQAGSQQGLSGAASSFDPRPYRSCSRQEQRAIGLAYSQSHARAMDNYCQGLVQTAVSRSRELGVAGQANQNSRIFGNCSRTTVSRARAAANQAYGQGLAQYCAAPNIESIGQREGSQGQLSGNALGQYRVCTPRLFASIQSRYQRGADAGLAVFCGDDKLRVSARQVAKTSNRAPLPRAFSVCLQRYPDTSRAYQQILLQEREQVVSTLCTYQRGETQGRQDARAGNRKRTAVPAFCDRNGFSIYLTGYLEGWNNKKGKLCSAIDAYQRGRRDATEGRTRSYRAPDLCRGQTNQLSNKYMEGYRDASRELDNA